MSKPDTAALDTAATADRTATLGARSQRALGECMTVLPEAPDVGIYVVVGENGNGAYTVDVEGGRCTCPDARYNLPESGRCKHEQRARFAAGIDAVPADADHDPLLGEHVEGGPILAASDGGDSTAETEAAE